MKLFHRPLKLIVFIMLLFPVQNFIAQDDPFQNTEQTDESSEKKKKKKDADADFFQFEVNKLSGKFFGRLAINLLTVLILIRFIYLSSGGGTGMFQTFFIFNFVIFLVTYLLSKVDLSLGAAFGLFAVFSILRFRTEGLTARDMTYLFLVIAVGLINAVAKGTIAEMLIIDTSVILLAYGLEGNRLLRNKEFSKTIMYDNTELVKPENNVQLLEDLKKKTGLNVTRVTVNGIDFLKDSSELIIYYK